MLVEAQGRMATNPVFSIVVLTAVLVWMAIGAIGSFFQARSLGQPHGDDRSQGQLYQDDPPQSVDQSDDDYWFMGFYNNPEDPSLYAAASFLRRGLNLGNPVGLTLFTIVFLGLVALDVFAILAVSS